MFATQAKLPGMPATYEHLREVLTAEFEIEPELITLDADLFEDLDIDSIDAIDMLARLRELTGIALPADALKQVRTIGDVVALVDAQIADDAAVEVDQEAGSLVGRQQPVG